MSETGRGFLGCACGRLMEFVLNPKISHRPASPASQRRSAAVEREGVAHIVTDRGVTSKQLHSLSSAGVLVMTV
jgi:hypothetical protein